jgi:hypothetical protein
VTESADLGIYDKGVVLKISPLDIIYVNVKSTDAERITRPQ